MQLFNNHKNTLSSLKEIPFKLEKDIQNLFEANMQTLMNLQMVKSEFSIKNNRIDTLAFDAETKAFVIVEYKRNQNYSVVDQGVSYLNLLLENKAEFIVEYNETQNQNLKRNDVDWSQSKVIFVSPSFTDFQKSASNFNDLPIELWEIKQFENDIVIINPLKKSKSAPSIKQVQQNDDSDIAKITKEVKVYTEEDRLLGKSDDVIDLYESFRNGILNLSNEIEIKPQKWYIAFKIKRNIADIEIQKQNLKVYINLKKGELDDPKNLTRDVSNLGHAGNGDYEITVSDTQNLEYIMSLIKQAL